MSNPTPFVNTPPPRRGPGCWAIGGVTCLVVSILGALVVFGMGYSLLHSPAGHKAGSAFGKLVTSAQDEVACVQKMQSIRDAVIRYHISKGRYPKSLADLVPDYVADPALLHCPTDPNPDPKHVTFVYTCPSPGAPETAPILTFTAAMTMTLDDQTQTSETTMTLTLGGKMIQSQKVIQNGKVIRDIPAR